MAKQTMKREVPFSFFLEAAEADRLVRKPMFGSWAFYRDEKILFIVRDRESYPRDNGIWVVAEPEQVESIKADLDSLRRIELFESENGVPTWNNLPADDERFEEQALRFAEMIVNEDPRVGRIPKGRRISKKPKAEAKIASKAKPAKKARKGAKKTAPKKSVPRKKKAAKKAARKTKR